MINELEQMIGEEVVVDTNSSYVYIGRLSSAADGCITLEDVDVHCIDDSKSPRELYIMEAKKFGVNKNRRAVLVMFPVITSISLLEDVVVF